MGILIPLMLVAGLVTAGISLWNNASTNSVAAVADAWKAKEVREGDQSRTDLDGIYAVKMSSTTFAVKFWNSGQTLLGDFDTWDVIVQYTATDGIPRVTRLTYTTGSLTANTWKLQGIYTKATKIGEVFNRSLLDPKEEAIMLVSVSPAIGGDTATIVVSPPNGFIMTTTWLAPGTYYLQNDPTPPTGNTNQQQPLPMDFIAPTATTLYNYDADRDAAAGRLVARGGPTQTETDPTKYQAWRSEPLIAPLTLGGTLTFEIWSAMKDFNNSSKRGSISVYLRDYDGSSYTEIASTHYTSFPWDSQNTWVKKTISITIATAYTVAEGHELELKLIVPASASGGNTPAQDDMWFAYDTTSYASVLKFP